MDAFSSLCFHQTVAKMVQELYNYVDADLSIMLRLMETHIALWQLVRFVNNSCIFDNLFPAVISTMLFSHMSI